jgi:hypothetical protein
MRQRAPLTATLARLPNLVDRLSALECFNAAFHNADDFALTRLRVDAAGMDNNLIILGAAGTDATSASVLPTRLLAAAYPLRSGTVSKSLIGPSRSIARSCRPTVGRS